MKVNITRSKIVPPTFGDLKPGNRFFVHKAEFIAVVCDDSHDAGNAVRLSDGEVQSFRSSQTVRLAKNEAAKNSGLVDFASIGVGQGFGWRRAVCVKTVGMSTYGTHVCNAINLRTGEEMSFKKADKVRRIQVAVNIK